MAKQLVLILNPSAGLKQGKRYLADIISIFEAHDYVCLTLVTRQRGDAPRLAAQYAPTADLVVAIGGDGTFNEVISGLIASGATCPVGYIPAGSTNDLGASLGLSRNLLQCAQEIMEGAPSGLDVGSFSGRSFTYVASFGAFTRAYLRRAAERQEPAGTPGLCARGRKGSLVAAPGARAFRDRRRRF